ncbi:hypothetical protein Dimus_005344 [Dionaea muscipula]
MPAAGLTVNGRTQGSVGQWPVVVYRRPVVVVVVLGVSPGGPLAASSGRAVAGSLGDGASNGGRSLSVVGGNGTAKAISGASRNVSIGNSVNSSSLPSSNFDGKGTYLIFNVGDTIYISDLNSHDKDPIKSIHFGNSNPVCHAFDPEAKDGHDLLIGLNSGDGNIYCLASSGFCGLVMLICH